MTRRSLSLAVALWCSTSMPTASAQVVTDHAARPPPVDVATPSPPATEPAVPSPEVPEALRARVEALSHVVADTGDCYTYRGERTEHIADRRCAAWLATLQRGGSAAAHAIGRSLVSEGERYLGNPTFEGAEQTGPRLVQVLAATGAPEVVPYLLRRLWVSSRRQVVPWATEREVLRQLVRLTGDDAAPVAPWEGEAYEDSARRRAVAVGWSRWWSQHGAETPAQRAAVGLAHAQSDLHSDDPAARYAAMVRLVDEPGQREAVGTAMRELLARTDLPAPAVSHLRHWAQRARLPIATARR